MINRIAGKSRLPIWLVHCLMLSTAALTSTSFTVGKAIATGMDPAALTLVRFLLAVLLFMPLVYWRYKIVLPDKHALLRYALISLSLTGFFWLMFVALQTTTAFHTGVLFTLVPGISSIYSAIFLKERLGRYRLAAMIPAMLGAVWVIFDGSITQLLSFELNMGDGIFLVSCFLVALYTPLIKLLHRGEPMAVMTFWILVTGCGWLLLFSGYHLPDVPWRAISSQVWAGILYLALFCTILSFFLSQLSTLYLGPTRVMAYSYLYPPFILVLDWIFSNQLPQLKTIPGIVLIMMAMVIVQCGATRTEQLQKTNRLE